MWLAHLHLIIFLSTYLNDNDNINNYNDHIDHNYHDNHHLKNDNVHINKFIKLQKNNFFD